MPSQPTLDHIGVSAVHFVLPAKLVAPLDTDCRDVSKSSFHFAIKQRNWNPDHFTHIIS